MGFSDWTYLDVIMIRQETPKGLQLVLEDGEIFWVPRSQVEGGDELRAGMENVTVALAKWLAIEKGLCDPSD